MEAGYEGEENLYLCLSLFLVLFLKAVLEEKIEQLLKERDENLQRESLLVMPSSLPCTAPSDTKMPKLSFSTSSTSSISSLILSPTIISLSPTASPMKPFGGHLSPSHKGSH